MSEDEFYQRAEAVKLDTLSDVNDIGKPWRYEEDGLTVTRGSAWSGPGCHLGCGVRLYTDGEGRLVKVEGIGRTRSTKAGSASAASTCPRSCIMTAACCIR